MAILAPKRKLEWEEEEQSLKKKNCIEFGDLPVEIADKIFSYLRGATLLNAKLVSSLWNDIISANITSISRLRDRSITVNVESEGVPHVDSHITCLTLEGIVTGHDVHGLLSMAPHMECLHIASLNGLKTGFWDTISVSFAELKYLSISFISSTIIPYLRFQQLTTLRIEEISRPIAKSEWINLCKNNPKLKTILFKHCCNDMTCPQRRLKFIKV